MAERMIHRLGVFALIVVIAALLLAGASRAWSRDAPRVEQGLIDLRGWDFARRGAVALDGRWSFAWGRFLEPGPAGQASAAPPTAFIDVPDVWNDHRVGAERIGGFGHATYRLRVQLDPDPPPLALHVIDAASAWRIYADGRLVYQAGSPGPSRARSHPCFKPAVVVLPPLSSDFDVTVHISNFHHRQGGLWDRILIGPPKALHDLRERRIAFNMVLLGSLLLMGLYHLDLYRQRRADPTSLFFGLACLAALLRTLTTGERYLVQLFDGFPFELLSKLEYWGFYITVGCLALFIHAIFPEEADRRVARGLAILSALFSLLVLVTPLRIYSYSTPPFELITLAAMVYGVVVLGRALGRQKPGATLFLTGFLVLTATGVNDILYSRQFIHTLYVGQFGLLFFVLAQSVLLSRRFSTLFETIEFQRIRLRASEERYRQVVSNANEAIFIVSNGSFRFVNPATEALFGYSAAELASIPFEACVHPDHREAAVGHQDKASQTGSPVAAETFRLIDHAGRVKWVSRNLVPIEWEGRPATLNFLRDISDYKKIGSQMNLARKMAAMRTLAAGIVRDFGGLERRVADGIRAVLERLPSDSLLRPDLEAVLEDCIASRRLMAPFLPLGRVQELRLAPTRIGNAIQEAVSLLEADAGIRVETEISLPGPLVMAEAGRIGQMLFHLGVNALEAMAEGGGTLRVSLDTVRIPAAAAPPAGGLAAGTYARLTVADSGHGIGEEIQDRVFDPYFTTRDGGRGMGLTAVIGIVQNHGGHINLVSTPGVGTTVHVYLPALEAVSGPSMEEGASPGAS